MEHWLVVDPGENNVGTELWINTLGLFLSISKTLEGPGLRPRLRA